MEKNKKALDIPPLSCYNMEKVGRSLAHFEV